MRPAQRHPNLAVAAIFLASGALLAAAPAARAQVETENEDEFSYVPGAKNGPENWGRIKTEWANCSKGQMQSPIDLSDLRVNIKRDLGFLNHSYLPAKATIINRGHDIQVKFDGDAGRLTINGTVYDLKQLHWHSPTEHSINGRRYNLELHMVHESALNKAAVIGILYQFGHPDPFLRKLEPLIRKIANSKNRSEDAGVVDPNEARGMSSVYYRYMGSLTTPPCSEGVIWTVIKKIHTVSREQVQLLRDAVDDNSEQNARPIQKFNNRDLALSVPKLYPKMN